MCKRQTNLFELLQSDETEFWEKLSQIDVKQFTQNITTQKTKQDN